MNASSSTGHAAATRSTCRGAPEPEPAGRTMRDTAMLLAMLWATLAAAAEPRIMAFENAWNRADTLAVQSNWSRRLDSGVIEAQARLAQAAEAGGLHARALRILRCTSCWPLDRGRRQFFQQEISNMKYLLTAVCLCLVGCNSLLPRGNHAVEGPWQSFDDAQQAFDKIAPYQTRVADLKGLGLDPVSTPNITLLNYSDVVTRFIPSPAINPDTLDTGVRDCIQAQTACRGFEIDQKHIKRTRTGNFWPDFLNFSRQTDVTGWQFKGTVLIKDDVIVYKLIGGQPMIREVEYNRNPLGPLQGIGESTVRSMF